jgi:hypothetical protein
MNNQVENAAKLELCDEKKGQQSFWKAYALSAANRKFI